MTAVLYTEDPAVAGAMGRCLTARSIDPDHRLTNAHPRACGWCDYPTEELRAGLAEFVAWAGFDDPHSARTSRHATRAFADLHREEQDALITAAQVLVAEKPAKAEPQPQAPTLEPPVAADEEVPSWLA